MNVCDFAHGVSLREREELEKALQPGEDIYWATKPESRVICAENGFLLAFTALWLGFVIFWTIAALGFPTCWADLTAISRK